MAIVLGTRSKRAPLTACSSALHVPRYPILYVFRRGAVVLLYMSGIPNRPGFPPGTTPLGVDWRIGCVMLLALSTVLLFMTEPWRQASENRLEMFSMQFLMVQLMVDFGDNSPEAIYSIVTMALTTTTMCAILLQTLWSTRHKLKSAAQNWQAIHHRHTMTEILDLAGHPRREEFRHSLVDFFISHDKIFNFPPGPGSDGEYRLSRCSPVCSRRRCSVAVLNCLCAKQARRWTRPRGSKFMPSAKI